MDTICLICKTPLADGSVVCRRDAEPARESLAYILGRRLLGELETATTRQVRFGPGSGGRRATDDTPMPVNLLAGDVEHRTRNTLTTWARVVMDHRGTTPEEVWPDIVPPIGPRCRKGGQATWCTHSSCRRIVMGNDPVPLERVAQFLLDRINGILYLEQAPEILADLARLRGDIESVCDAPPKLIALGQCDGTLEDGSVCGTELRARKDATLITCRYCGEPYSVQTRIAQLLRRVDALQATAPVIARVLSDWMGKPLPVDTIHQWAKRDKITRRGTDPATRGAIYRLGDVKALHQQSIQRSILKAARIAEKEAQAA
jgi:hypothetical protein